MPHEVPDKPLGATCMFGTLCIGDPGRINYALVPVGLGHLVEQFDITVVVNEYLTCHFIIQCYWLYVRYSKYFLALSADMYSPGCMYPWYDMFRIWV